MKLFFLCLNYTKMSTVLVTSDDEPLDSILETMTDMGLEDHYRNQPMSSDKEDAVLRNLLDPDRIVSNEPIISFDSEHLFVSKAHHSFSDLKERKEVKSGGKEETGQRAGESLSLKSESLTHGNPISNRRREKEFASSSEEKEMEKDAQSYTLPVPSNEQVKEVRLLMQPWNKEKTKQSNINDFDVQMDKALTQGISSLDTSSEDDKDYQEGKKKEEEEMHTEETPKGSGLRTFTGVSSSSSEDDGQSAEIGLETIPNQQQAYGLDDLDLSEEEEEETKEKVEIKTSAFDALKATVDFSSSEDSTGYESDNSSSEEEHVDDEIGQAKELPEDSFGLVSESNCQTVTPVAMMPPCKEPEELLKDSEAIFDRLEAALSKAETNIASQLAGHLGPFEEEALDTDELLKKYVGVDMEADTPLYTNAKFFRLFVTSVMMHGCRLALQGIDQKSDNQKISKSPHPLLRGTQRTELWKQFWGTQMPERGQALEDLQDKYQAELPILRIWSCFRRKTSKMDPVCGIKMASQWNYPLISALMFSARFRFTKGRVPCVPQGRSTDSKHNYYCALTGVPILGGTEAYLCSFLCEVASTVKEPSEEYKQEGIGKKRKKSGKKTEPGKKIVRNIQEMACVVQATMPSRSTSDTERTNRVDSKPLLKALRAISEFDKIIAEWVASWVEKHASKLPNQKRDSVAYAMTSAEGLHEIGKWYTTFQVLVALTHHAMCV